MKFPVFQFTPLPFVPSPGTSDRSLALSSRGKTPHWIFVPMDKILLSIFFSRLSGPNSLSLSRPSFISMALLQLCLTRAQQREGSGSPSNTCCGHSAWCRAGCFATRAHGMISLAFSRTLRRFSPKMLSRSAVQGDSSPGAGIVNFPLFSSMKLLLTLPSSLPRSLWVAGHPSGLSVTHLKRPEKNWGL